MSKKILIIGATSAIAKSVARRFAVQNCSFFLVARNQHTLTLFANELKTLTTSKIENFILDINEYEKHRSMLDQAFKFLGEIDMVLIAHGSLSNQQDCENDVALTLQEFTTNLLSSISLLTLIANKFEAQKYGTIAVISSVAGDRGRRSNYIYNSAKGGLNIFLQGLRNRLYFNNVKVLTIKPGFVDTPMTANFRKNFLWATPEKVAKDIHHAIEQHRNYIYTPWWWIIIMLIIKLIPESIYKRIKW